MCLCLTSKIGISATLAVSIGERLIDCKTCVDNFERRGNRYLGAGAVKDASIFGTKANSWCSGFLHIFVKSPVACGNCSKRTDERRIIKEIATAKIVGVLIIKNEKIC